MVRVRLTRKLANSIDGIDLRKVKSGDVVDVSPDEARILIAEGWGRADDSEQKLAPKKIKNKKRKRPSKPPR
jgi:hypothetical protein